ncbi:MAG: PAS domain S-box protein [Flavobacteriales bacterium]|nr:PAS domain S-box protein [Flavobacteriales bacterium]
MRKFGAMSATRPREQDKEVELAKAYLSIKQQYDDLVSRNMAGVFRTTMDGRFLECNASMARILGFPDEETLMKQPVSALYFDMRDRDVYLAELLEKGHLINHTVQLRHANGQVVHAMENVHVNRQKGKPDTIEGTLIDTTALIQAEMEQRALLDNYRRLVERIRDGIMIVQRGQVRYANPAADALVDGPLSGKELEQLLHPEDRGACAELFQEAERNGKSGPMELRFGGTAGTWHERLVEASATFHEGAPAIQIGLHDPGPERALMRERMRAQMAEEVNLVLRQEINEHRRTQAQLHRSRRFARSLVDSSLDMIIAVDGEGLITEFNPAATIKFGFEAEEVLGRPSSKLYSDSGEYGRIQKELTAHGAFAGEVRNVDRNGREFLSFLAASRLYDESGQLLGSMGVSRDITAMKRDEEALRASEERYRDLFENAMDLIQSVDQDGRIEYVNDSWKRTLGYTDEEVCRLTLKEVVHPDHLTTFEERFRRVMAGESVERISTVFLAKDGRPVRVEGTTNLRRVDGRPSATRSIFTDVSHVHAARRKVEEHEAKLRALFESSDHMFWTVDHRIALTSFNRGYADMIERLHGSRPEVNNAPDEPRKQFASPEYHSFWEAKYAEAFRGRPLRFETELHDARGRFVSNEIFLSPVFDADGSVKEVFGVGHEITEQKLAERIVREQAARLTAIFENSANMMVWTLDNAFRITSLNDHFRDSSQEAFGYTPVIGDAFLDHMLERLASKVRRTVRAHYEAAMKGRPQQFEVELLDNSGDSRWVENFLNPIKVDGEVREISCLAYGITEKKLAEQQLRESLNEKEVLLKEVHHRVKNNLQVISSILNLQTAYVGEDKRMLDLIHESQDRIRSMSFIHESLYQTKNFSSVDLASYIERLTRNLVMSYSVSGKVALETDLERVDLTLDQAIPCGLILNELISNALKHGFPDGRAGTIHIGLRCKDERVRIELADDGVGMPKDLDPDTQGSLGLQLVHTLIDQLDATLDRPIGPGVRYFLTFERIK